MNRSRREVHGRAAPILEPDMGGEADMGMPSDDMSTMPSDDVGTIPTNDMGAMLGDDMGGATGGDMAGWPRLDGGTSQQDGGPPSNPRTGKELSDSGCCATADSRKLEGTWLFLGLALVALRRRRASR